MGGKSQAKLFSEESIEVKEKRCKKRRKIVFKPYSQKQEFLLPKNIDDYIGPGHIARLVSAIIDKMDIEFIIETYKGGGTSSYDPKMMLKCWILAFIYRIYSCRLLAKNIRENLAFIWISGNQTPDFHTLNNFRLRLKDDIKLIFKEIVLQGIKAGIIEGKDIFVDHTKTEANANRHKIVWKKQVEKQSAKIDEELDELFEYIDKINDDEEQIFGSKDLPEQERNNFDENKVQEIIDNVNENVKEGKITKEEGREQRKKVRRTKELLERKENYQKKKEILIERNSFSKTDHDAIAMMMKDKLIKPAYNEGIAVENGLVLNYIIDDHCGDSVSFIPLMDGVVENIGKKPENVNTDGAYGNEENHAYLEEKEIGNYLKFNLYHKEKSKKWREEKFRLNDFTYDEKKDEFICKNNVKLKFTEERERLTKTGYIQKSKKYKAPENACVNCAFRDKCTDSNARGLHVSWNAERLKDKARENLNSEKGEELRKRRGNEVESVFGDQKLNKLKKRYHLRGLKKVNVEAGLYYISHNIRRMHKLIEEERKSEEKIIENKFEKMIDGLKFSYN